jgi:hypothetical protein
MSVFIQRRINHNVSFQSKESAQAYADGIIFALNHSTIGFKPIKFLKIEEEDDKTFTASFEVLERSH